MKLDLGNKEDVSDRREIRLINKMGTDKTIVDSARISYGESKVAKRTDENLIRYLMRHEHHTPFESCVAQFRIVAPIFVARQWFRHRMGSFNEVSGRYTEILDGSYIPTEENYRKQSITNKQGGEDPLDEEQSNYVYRTLREQEEATMRRYHGLLSTGLAREQARWVLSMNTFTSFYWTVNLRSLLHFCKLRCHSSAQKEIRDYANAILNQFVKQWVPWTYQAFIDFVLEARTFSRKEVEVIREGLFERGSNIGPVIEVRLQDKMTDKEIKAFRRALAK